MLLTLSAAHPRGTHPFPRQDPVKLGGIFWNVKPGGFQMALLVPWGPLDMPPGPSWEGRLGSDLQEPLPT